MNLSGTNPTIENKQFQGTDSLYFKFYGVLTGPNASDAVNTWREKVSSQNRKFVHIWNCVNMTGYEPMARVTWQKAMKEMKDHIDKIWLVSDSTLILTGAKLLSLFSSLEIKPVKSEEDIQL